MAIELSEVPIYKINFKYYKQKELSNLVDIICICQILDSLQVAKAEILGYPSVVDWWFYLSQIYGASRG